MSEYPQRFRALDAWRGLCALWVAAYHFRVIGHLSSTEFVRSGAIAVDFFFVLSGFVICHGFGTKLVDRTSRVQFIIRRFGRLYPLHIFTLLIVLGMELARWAAAAQLGRPIGGPPFSGDTSLPALAANVVLIQGLGFLPNFTWNVPSWSISVEFALCFGFLLLSLSRRRYAAAAIAALAGGLALILIRYAWPHGPESWTALPRGVYAFFLGVLCYGLYQRFRGWRPTVLHEVVAIPAIAFASYAHPAVTTLAFAYAVFIFAFEAGAISRILNRTFLVRWGDLSYSVYLLHYPMILAAFGGAIALGAGTQVGSFLDIGSPWLADALMIVFLAIVLVAAAVSYRLIEVPARTYFNVHSAEWARRLASSRQARSSAAELPGPAESS